jgi:hypothetical protein
MSFLCPIGGVEVAWHNYVHLGLTAVAVVTGAVFLVAAISAFLRTADRRKTSRDYVAERRS